MDFLILKWGSREAIARGKFLSTIANSNLSLTSLVYYTFLKAIHHKIASSRGGYFLKYFWAEGRRWGQPGQQQGCFLPSATSSTIR